MQNLVQTVFEGVGDSSSWVAAMLELARDIS